MRSRFSWQRHPVAKALYDNVAEAPDELAFRKGDVLAVLEQNTAGLEGWWLCYHRGRQVTRRRFRSERRPTPAQMDQYFSERRVFSARAGCRL